MRHRIGFIGYGSMGSNYHYQVAQDRKDAHEDFAPAAVFDVRQSQRDLAVERGLKAYDNLNDFLADDSFDMVLVATPNQFHCELTCKALEAGKHVICEKPVALSIEEFDKMVETANRTGKYFFVHQNRRFDCEFCLCKHAYETGRIGKLKHVDAYVSGGYMNGWRTLKSHGGGMLLDWGVHLLDQVIYLLADDKPVSVYAEVDSNFLTEVDDYAAININFRSGATARVLVSGEPLPHMARLVLHGDKGRVWVDNGYDKTAKLDAGTELRVHHAPIDAYDENYEHYVTPKTVISKMNQTTVDYPDDGFEVNQDWVGLYKSMFDTIDNGAPMLVKYEQVRDVLKIILAAYKSSETKQVVQL